MILLKYQATSPEFDYQQYINKSQAVQTQNDTTQVSRPIQTVDSLQQPKINELYQYRNVPRIPQNVDKSSPITNISPNFSNSRCKYKYSFSKKINYPN